MPPSGPPPASASPILAFARRDDCVVASACVRLRVRVRGTRPDAVVSGMVLLTGVERNLRRTTGPSEIPRRRGRLASPFARNGSGELLLRGGPDLARATLDRLRRALLGYALRRTGPFLRGRLRPGRLHIGR